MPFFQHKRRFAGFAAPVGALADAAGLRVVSALRPGAGFAAVVEALTDTPPAPGGGSSLGKGTATGTCSAGGSAVTPWLAGTARGGVA
jgi:hypothetical protein